MINRPTLTSYLCGVMERQMCASGRHREAVCSLPSHDDSVVVESHKMYENKTTGKSITVRWFSGSKQPDCFGLGFGCLVFWRSIAAEICNVYLVLERQRVILESARKTLTL